MNITVANIAINSSSLINDSIGNHIHWFASSSSIIEIIMHIIMLVIAPVTIQMYIFNLLRKFFIFCDGTSFNILSNLKAPNQEKALKPAGLNCLMETISALPSPEKVSLSCLCCCCLDVIRSSQSVVSNTTAVENQKP